MTNPKTSPYCPIHSASRIGWRGNNGTAFASDIDNPIRGLHARVWDDACDVGFILENPLSDRQVVFTLVEVLTDREGETVGWRYESHDFTRKLTVTIFND
jgi:hypothetical protein